MEKYMRETLNVVFNGEESDVFTLATPQIQTLLERINHDAHQVLEDRFVSWAVKEGITLKKQSKNDDRTFLAVLPDLGGMAVTSVTFLSRNACKNWLTYGSSIKESIGPDEDNEDWAEPDFTIRAIGYKLTSKGTPSLQESEKCETYLRFWEEEYQTVFESPVQKDIREREEDMANFQDDLHKDLVEKAFGSRATENWNTFNSQVKDALYSAARAAQSVKTETACEGVPWDHNGKFRNPVTI